MDYKKEWEKIVNTHDFRNALVDHFSYLAESEESKQLLREWMDQVKEVTIWDKDLNLKFSDGKHFAASPPATKLSKYKNWPESYQKLLIHHEFLREYGSNFCLGGTDIFDPEDWDWSSIREELIEECGTDLEGWSQIKNGRKILSPIVMYGNVWLYHPVKKNSNNEPCLYFFSHELCDWPENPVDLSVGTLALQLLTGKRSGDNGNLY
ncbi:hypothetical protein [Leptospira weilii]|uniref:hypothetical protein n=1 Tax=Leptospira weilii TaxID=28184 RepID=UPI000773EC6D|nr:hypothetical protein [Leptospira weilii]